MGLGDRDTENVVVMDTVVDTDPQYYVAGLRERLGLSAIETLIPKPLIDSMTAIIWNMSYINAEPTFYKRLLDDLNILLMNGDLKAEDKTEGNGKLVTEPNNNEENDGSEDQQKPKPSDIRDLLEYKPTEIISDKSTQILTQLCLGEVSSCYKEMKTLKQMLEQQCVKLHNDNHIGFWFIARTLECFANFITGRKEELFSDNTQGGDIPDFKSIPEKSRMTVTVAKCLIGRHFCYSAIERMEAMKQVTVEDPTNFEWFITSAEITRKKRRDAREANIFIGAKKAIQDEYDAVAEALVLAPENPYVQLSVLDCVIDCLRETKGVFRCGELIFESADEAVQYMRLTSRKLVEDFPNSVKIHSLISDYFCRFVPFRYFDIPFAERCLKRAYELNPINPKTTHRLGIFTRMSKGDIETSYKWFQRTVELNPMHFNATMECIKNKLARLAEEKVIDYMDGLIATPAVSCWTEHEILELLFYKGLAHFALDDKEKALEVWKIVVERNDYLFRLNDLDRTCGFYYWNDMQISSDQLRIWVNEEKKSLKNAKADGDRQKLIELLFSLMIGGGYPSRPCRNSGPFHPSQTYQLLQGKYLNA